MKKHTTLRASVLELTRSALVLSSRASAARDVQLSKLVARHGVRRVLAEIVELIDVTPDDRALLVRHYAADARNNVRALLVLASFAGHGPWAGRSKAARAFRWEHVEWVWHFQNLRRDERALRAALYSGPERMRETLYGGRIERRRSRAAIVIDASARFTGRAA